MSRLTRSFIRERLIAAQAGKVSGDVATAARLLSEGDLQPYDGKGILSSSGIPYDRGAGAPGVEFTPMAAAVLVPLIERPDGFTVLLTQRTADLKQHAGQIAFPGGRMEADDATPEAGALREAAEETGLDPAAVEILGRLDKYLTITGFEVIPIVGAVSPPVSFAPDPTEVADLFEVPLAFLLDPANHLRVEREHQGLKRAYYAMPYGERYIWGATAGMLKNLSEVLTS